MKIKLILICFITAFAYSQNINAQCEITLGSDIEVCYDDLPVSLGDNLTIVADPGYAIMWDNGLGSDPNPSVSPETTTTYTISLSDGACSDSDEITVIVHKPVADAGPDVQLCFGEEIMLDGTGSYSDTPIFNYSWGPSFYVDADQEDSPTPLISMTSTGALQLTVTDANFCSDTDQITVIVNSLPDVDAGDDYEFCWEGTPIVQNLTGSPSSGTWSGDGITDPDGEYTGTEAGLDILYYSYTNFIGCTNVDSIEVNIIETTAPDLGPNYGVCFSTTPIQLATGGTWSGSNVTADGLFTPISIGNNNLTYTIEENGCTASDNITIIVYANPGADAGPNLEICIGAQVLIEGNAVETTNPIASQSWSGNDIVGASNQMDVTVEPNGTESYVLTVTDTEGCEATDQVTVSLFDETLVDAGDDITVCEYSTPETITLTGFSPVAGGGESSQWIGPGIIDPSGIYEDSGIGSHSLTYEFTDANGCITSDDIFVTIATPDAVDAGVDQDVCLNTSDVQLTQPGTWSGTNVTSDGVFTPSSIGEFTLDFEIMSGTCMSTDQIVVTVHDLPDADAGADQTMCLGTPAMLSGSGVSENMPIVDYEWSVGENIDAPNSQNTDVDPTSSQSYTLTITDNEGCISSDDVMVTVDPLPVVNAGDDLDLCDQPIEETLTGFSPIPSGSETGVWTGTGITDPNGTFLSPGPGDYTLTYTFTDNNGCSNSDDIVVSVFDPVPADAGSDEDICIGNYNHTLTGFSPSNGTWSGPGIIDADLGVIDVDAIGVGVHVYTLEAGSGTCFTSDEMQLTVHDLPSANAGSDQEICFGEIAMLSGSGASVNMPLVSFLWSGGENIDSPNSQDTDVEPTFTQTYTILIEDNKGCQNTDEIEIVVNALPVVDAGLNFEVCDQPIAEVLTGFGPIPSGSETGVWTGTGISDPDGEFTSPGIGDYTLTYTFTDSNTCSNSDDIIVSVVGATVADAGSDDNICYGVFNHTLTGFTPSSATWSGPGIVDSSTGEIDVVAAGLGSHIYTLESGSGTCYSQDEMELTIHDLPTADAGTDKEICFGELVMLSGSGASSNMPIVDYLWSGGESIESPLSNNTNVEPTFTQSYTLQITDDEGCQNTDEVEVVVNALPLVDAGLDFEVCDLPIAETLVGFGPIPSGSETGVWTGTGISNPDGEFTSPGVGDYTLTYTFTDENTCANTDEIIATVVAPEVVTAGVDQTVCYGLYTYTIDGFAPTTGGFWTGPGIVDSEAGIIDLETAGIGTFNYTIEHGTGTCYQSDVVIIDILAPPLVEAGINEEYCEGIEAFDMAGSTPSGGVWYGEGIIDGPNGTFDDVFGAYEYATYYVYTDPLTLCADTSYKTIIVHDNPVADFSVTLTQCKNVDLDLTNLSTGSNTYEWNFNNGDILTDETPSYSYNSEGLRTIQLVAFNSFGCSDTITYTTDVVDVPNANFDISDFEGCSTLDVSFVNNSSGDYEVYNWDFDNANTSLDENPGPQTFMEIDNDDTVYDIVLTVSNLCGSVEHTETVTIMSMPVADFSTDETDYCGITVTVNNNSVGNPTEYDWDWGDSSSNSTDQDPSPHDYPDLTTSESYTITLTTTNDCGSDITDHIVTIYPTNLSAGFSVDVDMGCMPLEVQITDESVGADDISYDFGNTDSSLDTNPLYTYDDDGNFTLEQTVSNFCGTETSSITIDVMPLPVVEFDLATLILCEGLDIEFNNMSDPLVMWNWDFDDATFSNDEDPIHVFTTSGDYNVSLSGESTVNGCSNNYEQLITVNDTPTSAFTADIVQGCAPLDVAFNNESTDADTYDWYFDDTFSDTAENPTHTFVNTTDLPISFFVTLIAENAAQCSDLSQVEVLVNPSPTAAFILSDTESCVFPVDVFTINQSDGANTYDWTVTGAGSYDSPEIDVTFDAVGVYTFELTVENTYNCTSYASSEFEVHPTPVMAFTPDVLDGCRELAVMFDNTTTGAATFAWDFGDGGTSSANSPTHTYIFPGVFDVELIATTNEGCSDTLLVMENIEVYDLPIADFSFTPEVIDIYDPIVQFQNESIDGVIYDWHFGDGYDSDEENPEHEYTSTGNFQISLTAINEFGCMDSHTKNLQITSDLTLYVPNAFSPNNDGINDIFIPSVLGKEFIDYYRFQIYNRWGILLFETTDINEFWVGDYNNGEYYVEPDSYNWIIDIRLSENVEIYRRKGTVNVLR